MNTISFNSYKESELLDPAQDPFEQDAHKGCSEDDFNIWLQIEAWTETMEFNSHIGEVIRLPLHVWEHLSQRYIHEKTLAFVNRQYPKDTFFEAKLDDQVACLLPNTENTDYLYKVAFYNASGPINHALFKHRHKAVDYIARQGFRFHPGALDDLVGTERWNRGIWINKWIQEGIDCVKGLYRDQHIPEVAHLFKRDLENSRDS